MKITTIAAAGALGAALAFGGPAWADSHNRRSDAHPEKEAKTVNGKVDKQSAAKTDRKQPVVVADSHNRRKKKD